MPLGFCNVCQRAFSFEGAADSANDCPLCGAAVRRIDVWEVRELLRTGFGRRRSARETAPPPSAPSA